MSEVDWQDIRLTIFDLDGTLYDQPPLRRAMAWSLLRDAVRKRSLRTILILRCFRRVRERLGEQTAGTGCGNFLREQYLETAVACGIDEGEVRACVEEWMERRPLALLSRYKAAGIDDLFAAIRATGRAVAVWSDYPVAAKLAALGLEADHAIWAGDSAVGRLKPDPKGLRILLSRAGVPAREAIVIGDRRDRDVAPAITVGAKVLLRSSRRFRALPSFWRFDEAIFSGLHKETGHGSAI